MCNFDFAECKCRDKWNFMCISSCCFIGEELLPFNIYGICGNNSILILVENSSILNQLSGLSGFFLKMLTFLDKFLIIQVFRFIRFDLLCSPSASMSMTNYSNPIFSMKLTECFLNPVQKHSSLQTL